MPENIVVAPSLNEGIDRLALQAEGVRTQALPSSCTCCYGAVCMSED